MRRNIALLLILSMLLGLVPVYGDTTSSTTQEHWATKYIQALQMEGLVPSSFALKGTDEAISRLEFCELMSRYLAADGAPAGTETFPAFSDLGGIDAKRVADISTVYAAGIVKGTGVTTFGPSSGATREQITAMLGRSMGITEGTFSVTDFADGAAVSEYARKYVGAIRKQGIVSGFPDGSFKPQQEMTIAQASTIIAKLLHTKGKLKYIEEFDLGDTDNDGLENEFERLLKSDKENPDTDADVLPDGWEVKTASTKPNMADTDGDGISDADEDEDNDGLTNLEEFKLGSHPGLVDSDMDELDDAAEKRLGSNPAEADSDKDGLRDNSELALGLNPLVADSSAVVTAEKQLDDVALTVNVKASAYDSVYMYSSINEDGAGLYMSPVMELGANEKIESATISFDLKKEVPENYAIFYIPDDVNEGIQLVDNQRIEGTKIIAELEHFSSYAVLDAAELAKRQAAFEKAYNEFGSVGHFSGDYVEYRKYTVFFTEMNSTKWSVMTDPRKKYGDTPDLEGNPPMWDYFRRHDKGLIDFQVYGSKNYPYFQYVPTLSALTNTRDTFGTFTSFLSGASKRIMHYEFADKITQVQQPKTIALFTTAIDTDFRDGSITVDEAVDFCLANRVVFNVVMGNKDLDTSDYEKITAATGGTLYTCVTAEEKQAVVERLNVDMLKQIEAEKPKSGKPATDSDGDGISDNLERVLIDGYGNYMITDPHKQDTDEDGLLDSEEVVLSSSVGQAGGTLVLTELIPLGVPKKVFVENSKRGDHVPFTAVDFSRRVSDPTARDTDMDGFFDKDERAGRCEIFDMSDRTLAFIAELAYSNVGVLHSGKVVSSYCSATNGSRDRLRNFTLVGYADSGLIDKAGRKIDRGFSAIALTSTALPAGTVILGFAGTQPSSLDIQDIVTDIYSLSGTTSAQDRQAIAFSGRYAASVKVYTTGHSLGGRLAQYAAITCGSDTICAVFNSLDIASSTVTLHRPGAFDIHAYSVRDDFVGDAAHYGTVRICRERTILTTTVDRQACSMTAPGILARHALHNFYIAYGEEWQSLDIRN